MVNSSVFMEKSHKPAYNRKTRIYLWNAKERILVMNSKFLSVEIFSISTIVKEKKENLTSLSNPAHCLSTSSKIKNITHKFTFSFKSQIYFILSYIFDFVFSTENFIYYLAPLRERLSFICMFAHSCLTSFIHIV